MTCGCRTSRRWRRRLRGAVVPAYIWSPEEEEPWAPGAASRWWLHHSLASLSRRLGERGSRLVIRRGPAAEALRKLVEETGADRVVWCRRYEPAAIERDQRVKASLVAVGIRAESFNGSLLHEPWTIATREGRPYQAFAPFWRTCQAAGPPADPLAAPDALQAPQRLPDGEPLDELKLLPSVPWDRDFYDAWQIGEEAAAARLREFVVHRLAAYKRDEKQLADEAFSRLSPHLHFGELSPRQVWAAIEPRARRLRRRCRKVF